MKNVSFNYCVHFNVAASVISAKTANPAPYPIIDEWSYGVGDNYSYSNYYVQSPNNIGLISSITNFGEQLRQLIDKNMDGHCQVLNTLGVIFD